jgi:hypothetical protein
MKQIVVLLGLWLMVLTAVAQDQPEYRLELGAGVGLVNYEGDFNNSLFGNLRPMGTLVAKYKTNPRMAWTLNVGYGQLKGSSKKAGTWYPNTATYPIDFKSSLVDVVVRFEYNFWPYGTGREYHGAKRLTPFIAIGAGVSASNAETTSNGEKNKKSAAALQMPIGIGVKYKMGDRWNLAAEWMMHFTGNDHLDGVADPYGIQSSGIFKNTDCYSVLGVTVTYDLWAKCKTCHNDRD